MKIKYIMCVMAIVAFTRDSFAQYSQDGFLFSTNQAGSTSRIKAIGNASTAIGGDLSSVSGNPAGIGFFTRSEFSITPEFNSTNVKSSYLATAGAASTGNINFNNASAVFYNRLNAPRGSNKDEGWVSVNFGVSINRTNDFYQNTYFSGTNTKNSISNYYADLANVGGVDPNGPNLQDMAYYNNLIDKYNNGGPLFQSNVFSANGTSAPNKPVNQINNLVREGGQTEFSFSMGANYGNQLYLGVGIGITSLRYNSNNQFTESGLASVFINNTASVMSYNSVFNQSQDTKGSGFNARLGFIYKPVDAVRFGASVTTPTWYTVQDDYAEGISTKLQNNSTYAAGPQDYPFTYNFSTPWKANGGLAVFIDKYGFISADVEYIDYSSIKFTADNGNGYDAVTDNHDIVSKYKSTVNAKIGGELKLDQLFLRAGYNLQQNPYRTGGSDIKTVSGGIGYRFAKYYLDFTYANVQGSQTSTPYITSTNQPVASLNKTTDNLFVTLGFRF